jgi:hypothetical protein
MFKYDLLSSGNPVTWDIERGGRSREILAVFHKRGHDTEHWAVRIDRATQRVSHISAGPILRTYDFQPEVSPQPWMACRAAKSSFSFKKCHLATAAFLL